MNKIKMSNMIPGQITQIVMSLMILFGSSQFISAQKTGGVNFKSGQHYINPVVLEGGQSVGDPTVIKYENKYWLYCSGGGGYVWSSDDLSHWKRLAMTLPAGQRIVAPCVFRYKGFFYMTGNDTGFSRSITPYGPWEYIGDFKDEKGEKKLLFDPMVFVNDDGRVYMYYSGRATNGIYGVELNPKELTRFVSAPKHFFSFNNTHIWERYGDMNEYSDASWIEAPWMTKHNGTYILQYSAAGTDWRTYAVGVYTSKSPLGPFTYYPGSPILRNREGLISGTGHHCIIAGPDGSLWAFYTVLYLNWNGMKGLERGIGMDPVGFDAKGNIFIKGASNTPQWNPGVKATPWKDNSLGLLPLAIDKLYTVSSEAPGKNAPYAFDNSTRTGWQPATGDAAPWLRLDLGHTATLPAEQQFTVQSCRLLFPPKRQTANSTTQPNRYKIEVSVDGNNYITVVDKTDNAIVNNVEFDEFAPVKCRYVRLSVSVTPGQALPEVREFSVFGLPISATTK